MQGFPQALSTLTGSACKQVQQGVHVVHSVYEQGFVGRALETLEKTL